MVNPVLTVKGTFITDTYGAGISLLPAATGSVNASFDNVRAENNQNGFTASDKATVVARNCCAAHNPVNGFILDCLVFNEVLSEARAWRNYAHPL